MKYSVGDEFPEVIFNWMDDNFEVQKAGSSELFQQKNYSHRNARSFFTNLFYDAPT